jgi:hypothetical protein
MFELPKPEKKLPKTAKFKNEPLKIRGFQRLWIAFFNFVKN